MKKYQHRTGNFIAKQTMYGGYDVIVFLGLEEQQHIVYSVPPHYQELIEKSNDWIQLIEVPIGQYYSKSDIVKAIGIASVHTMNNYDLHVKYPLHLHDFLYHFKNKIFQYLYK